METETQKGAFIHCAGCEEQRKHLVEEDFKVWRDQIKVTQRTAEKTNQLCAQY